MNIKKIIIGMSVATLATVSLSLSACGGGGGGGGSSGSNAPVPVAVPLNAPSNYQASPVSAGVNPSSTLYLQLVSNNVANLALSQGTSSAPIQFNAPTPPIPFSSFTSALFQLFNYSGAAPTVLVTSGLNTATVVNVTSSPLLMSTAAEVNNLVNVSWQQYQFGGVVSTSTPIGVFDNGAAYIGTNTTSGSFLAMQSSTSAPNAVPVVGASPESCLASSSSTAAASIADTVFPDGDHFIAIGTNFGELLMYGVAGQYAGQCQNLTSANGAQIYTKGSPIGALSYTNRTTSNPNSYGYFGTQNGQIWRITATSITTPTGFIQINGSTFNGNVPPAGTAGVLTALYSDASNNVYVGDANGNIYLLAANQINTWTRTYIGVKSPVLSISTTTNGKVIAITTNGIYQVSIVQ